MTPFTNLPPSEKKKLYRVAKIADQGTVGIVHELNALDDKVEETLGEVNSALGKIINNITTPIRQLVTFKDTKIATIRGKDGREGVDGAKGERGEKGDTGEQGPAGKDGKDGRDGAPGLNGHDGVDGVDGTNGKDGRDGINGVDGKDGKDGEKGEPGKDGAPGRSPVGWGAHPLTIQGLGITIDKHTRFINFTGSGLTSVTRSPDGVVTVTLTAGASSGTLVSEETPTNSGDDLNFTLANTPDTGTLRVFRGGARQQSIGATPDYALSGTTLTLTTALNSAAGEVLMVEYTYT